MKLRDYRDCKWKEMGRGMKDSQQTTSFGDELPTKEQINEINDLEVLSGWQLELEETIEKIRVDLEFSGKDDNWYHRARNALVYHVTTLSRVNGRIHRLTKKTNGNVDQAIQSKEAKAHRKEAHARQVEQLNEQKRIDAERQKANAKEETKKLLSRMNKDSIFRSIAASNLDASVFAQIEIAAHNEYEKRLLKEINYGD